MPRSKNKRFEDDNDYKKLVKDISKKDNLDYHIWKTDLLRRLLPLDYEIKYPDSVEGLIKDIVPLVEKIEQIIEKETGDHIIRQIKYGMELFRRCIVDIEEAAREKRSLQSLRSQILRMIAFLIKFAIDIHILNQPFLKIEKDIQRLYEDEETDDDEDEDII